MTCSLPVVLSWSESPPAPFPPGSRRGFPPGEGFLFGLGFSGCVVFLEGRFVPREPSGPAPEVRERLWEKGGKGTCVLCRFVSLSCSCRRLARLARVWRPGPENRRGRYRPKGLLWICPMAGGVWVCGTGWTVWWGSGIQGCFRDCFLSCISGSPRGRKLDTKTARGLFGRMAKNHARKKTSTILICTVSIFAENFAACSTGWRRNFPP